MTHLLRGSKRVGTPVGQTVTVFQKSGGLKRAEEDFYSLKPTDIQVTNILKASGVRKLF